MTGFPLLGRLKYAHMPAIAMIATMTWILSGLFFFGRCLPRTLARFSVHSCLTLPLRARDAPQLAQNFAFGNSCLPQFEQKFAIYCLLFNQLNKSPSSKSCSYFNNSEEWKVCSFTCPL